MSASRHLRNLKNKHWTIYSDPLARTFLLQFWSNFVLPLSYPKITAKTWSLMLFHPQFKDQWKVPPKSEFKTPYPPLPLLPYKSG